MAGESQPQDVSLLVPEELPQTFTVKYLGHAESRGLWGIKNTRAPVDRLVALAKQPGAVLPVMKLTISTTGCTLSAGGATRHHPIGRCSCPSRRYIYRPGV